MALITVLVAAGCGGGGDDAAEGTTTTTSSSSTTSTTEDVTTTTAAPEGVCDLITPDDILAAVQFTVEPGLASVAGDATVCSFQSADGSSQVIVSLFEPVGELIADTLAGDPDAKEVSGVGDEAVLQLERGRITMSFRGSGVVILVGPAPTEAALVQLAQIAGGHL